MRGRRSTVGKDKGYEARDASSTETVGVFAARAGNACCAGAEGERLERPFAHLYGRTDAATPRIPAWGNDNILKRVLNCTLAGLKTVGVADADAHGIVGDTLAVFRGNLRWRVFGCNLVRLRNLEARCPG